MIIITITTMESSSTSSTHRNVAELFVPMPGGVGGMGSKRGVL